MLRFIIPTLVNLNITGSCSVNTDSTLETSSASLLQPPNILIGNRKKDVKSYCGTAITEGQTYIQFVIQINNSDDKDGEYELKPIINKDKVKIFTCDVVDREGPLRYYKGEKKENRNDVLLDHMSQYVLCEKHKKHEKQVFVLLIGVDNKKGILEYLNSPAKAIEFNIELSPKGGGQYKDPIIFNSGVFRLNKEDEKFEEVYEDLQ
ncbi:hypothetical protein CDIK_1647 [Cucumispora dikerogammari]|nr:hypothetical protein CDIK_1647 [Cucumispora dikerogammari]